MPTMSTLRQDPTTRQWVILAPGRGTRPHAYPTFERAPLPEHEKSCPFCPGNEEETPPELLRVPDHPWRVRVVPNLYAALGGDGSTERSGPAMFREMPGIGHGEVVVESPRHDTRLDEMDLPDVEHVIRAWRQRYRTLAAMEETRAVIVFKNFGPLAGTSLIHPHSQIVSIPVFSPRLLHRINVATNYFDDTGHCLYDDMFEAEKVAGTRMIAERGCFISFEPFASASPYETWIAPTCHTASFGDLTDEQIPDLARVLAESLGAIRRGCGDPDFNLVIYSAPEDSHAEDVFCWHIKILPKLSSPAGFELGSAMGINIVAPETAADDLRTVLQNGS